MTDLNLMLLFAAIAVVGILVILCFVLCMICFGNIHKIRKNTANALTEEKMLAYVDKLREKGTGGGGNDPYALSKQAVVNFNAFDDITGEYSFSLALLDSFNNGVILTSLYGHNSCNTYIRKIKNGECATYLMEEEKEALKNALEGKE